MGSIKLLFPSLIVIHFLKWLHIFTIVFDVRGKNRIFHLKLKYSDINVNIQQLL